MERSEIQIQKSRNPETLQIKASCPHWSEWSPILILFSLSLYFFLPPSIPKLTTFFRHITSYSSVFGICLNVCALDKYKVLLGECLCLQRRHCSSWCVHCMIAFHSPTIKPSHCFQFPILQSSMRTLAQIPPGLCGKVWKVRSRLGVLAEGHPGNITEDCLKVLSGQLPSHSSMLEPVYIVCKSQLLNFQEFYKLVIKHSHY